jgi:hypothetical protein
MRYDAQQPMSDGTRPLVVLTAVGVAAVIISVLSIPGAYEFILARQLLSLLGVAVGLSAAGWVAFGAQADQRWVRMLLAGCVAGVFLWVAAQATADAELYRFSNCWVVSTSKSSTTEECAPGGGRPGEAAGSAGRIGFEESEGRVCRQSGTRPGGVTVWRCSP